MYHLTILFGTQVSPSVRQRTRVMRLVHWFNGVSTHRQTTHEAASDKGTIATRRPSAAASLNPVAPVRSRLTATTNQCTR